MTTDVRSLVQAHLAVFLLGFTGLFGKTIPLPPVILVFGRVFFAAMALLLCLIWIKEPLKLNSRKDYFALGGLGVLFALHWVAFYQAIQVSTVAVGVLAFATFPIFVALLEPLVLKSALRTSNLVASLAAFAGVGLMLPQIAWSDPLFQGAFFGVVSGVAFALVMVCNKKIVSRVSSVKILLYETGFATMTLFPFISVIPFTVSLGSFVQLVLLGVVCTALAYVLLIQSMKQLTASSAGIIGSLEPLWAVLFASALLGEILTARTLVGGSLILLSVGNVTLKRPQKHEMIP